MASILELMPLEHYTHRKNTDNQLLQGLNSTRYATPRSELILDYWLVENSDAEEPMNYVKITTFGFDGVGE